MTSPRMLLCRHLVGRGVELGPGHVPLRIGLPAVEISLVDRWRPHEQRDIFPDLPDAEWPEPDVLADFDTERLAPLADAGQDFVICSHVLEHLAEPIGFLVEIHRVLRPGGVALVLLPDRHRTFDRDRPPTPLEHLLAEFEAGVTEVDDAHLAAFVEGTKRWLAADDPGWLELTLEDHRRRSVHVHCWDDAEFAEVVAHGIEHLGMAWEFVDGVLPDDEGDEGIEFGLVLRRSPDAMVPGERADRFRTVYAQWRAAHQQRLSLLRHHRQAEQVLQAEVAALRAELSALRAELETVRTEGAAAAERLARITAHPAFRLAREVRALWRRRPVTPVRR